MPGRFKKIQKDKNRKGNNMEQDIRSNLRVVKDDDVLLQELEEKIRQRKRRFRMRVAIGVAIAVMVVVGTYFLIECQTYNEARIVNTYKNGTSGSGGYVRFANGVLRYSRDGVALLDEKGEELWNQPCQIKTPIAEVNQDAVAVGDSGGNNIMVFDRNGLKGEIKTDLPIEKLAVSPKGIVSAILKNEGSPIVTVYDATGNLLVEHKASISGSGYPMDVAVSEDGYRVMISYLSVQDGKLTGKVICYSFDEAGGDNPDHIVMEETYDNMIIPTVFFVKNNLAVAVGDSKFFIYKGEEKPEVLQEVELGQEIKSVFCDESNIGFVVKNEVGYELRLYDMSGKQVMSEQFSGEYSHVKMEKNQIIMYDGKKCSIYSKWGIHKFEGELENDIMEIIPMFGINKYLTISENEIQEVYLVK